MQIFDMFEGFGGSGLYRQIPHVFLYVLTCGGVWGMIVKLIYSVFSIFCVCTYMYFVYFLILFNDLGPGTGPKL